MYYYLNVYIIINLKKFEVGRSLPHCELVNALKKKSVSYRVMSQVYLCVR